MAWEQESQGRQQWHDRWIVFGCILILLLVVAWMVSRSLLGPREGHGFRGQCASNLRQIGALALLYSQRAGSGYFPYGPGAEPRAHESLNVLVDWDPEAIPHKLFVCPESNEEPAELDADTGKYVLTEHTLSYTWTSRRLRSSDASKPLASDKHCEGDAGGRAGHPGGMNLLMTDASVQWIEAGDLPPDTQLPEGLTR